jgi:hypothetical protein
MPQSTNLPAALPECKVPWSHFIMEGPRKAHAFSIEHCDKCGCEAEAANSITMHEPRMKLLSLYMVEAGKSDWLPELGYCDALQASVCPDCFVEEI